MLDKLLHRAQYQPPEYVAMTGGKGSSSRPFCELARQTFMIVLARIVVAQGSQINEAGKIPLDLRQSAIFKVPAGGLDFLIFEFAVHGSPIDSPFNFSFVVRFPTTLLPLAQYRG
jgi:hypothetical protein